MAIDLSAPPGTLPVGTRIKQGRLFTSNVLHLIDPDQPKHPDMSREEALCGVRPYWPGDWFPPEATGNENCGNCNARLEAMQRVRQP